MLKYVLQFYCKANVRKIVEIIAITMKRKAPNWSRDEIAGQAGNDGVDARSEPDMTEKQIAGQAGNDEKMPGRSRA